MEDIGLNAKTPKERFIKLEKRHKIVDEPRLI